MTFHIECLIKLVCLGGSIFDINLIKTLEGTVFCCFYISVNFWRKEVSKLMVFYCKRLFPEKAKIQEEVCSRIPI